VIKLPLAPKPYWTIVRLGAFFIFIAFSIFWLKIGIFLGQRHYVSHGQNLTAALVELQARTPHLKVFRLADNAALACSWTDAGVDDQTQLLPSQYGDEQVGGAGVPSLAQVSAGLSLLITNQHLHTLELPGSPIVFDLLCMYFTIFLCKRFLL
jgi:hypothetical protein